MSETEVARRVSAHKPLLCSLRCCHRDSAYASSKLMFKINSVGLRISEFDEVKLQTLQQIQVGLCSTYSYNGTAPRAA